jgi:hypothetical protein
MDAEFSAAVDWVRQSAGQSDVAGVIERHFRALELPYDS